MTHAFRVIGPWDVQPGLWLSHHITRSSMYPTKHWCCQHQGCVAFSLASSTEPVQHGCTYQELKTPAGIASGICEACKPPNYDKVTTLWGEVKFRIYCYYCTMCWCRVGCRCTYDMISLYKVIYAQVMWNDNYADVAYTIFDGLQQNLFLLFW